MTAAGRLDNEADAGGKRLRIASWPYLSNNNKFIELLLGTSTSAVEVSAIQSMHRSRPDPEADILLIHWPEFVFSSGIFPISDVRFVLRRLRAWKDNGTKLVWMVHDLEPHELPRGRRMLWRHYYRRKLAQLVDAIVTLSPSTLEVVHNAIPGIRGKPALHIWHPLFPGADGTEKERKGARRTFCFQPSQQVIASLGFIARYKGSDELARIFTESPDNNRRLLLAGLPKQTEPSLILGLRETAKKDQRVALAVRHLSEAELRQFTLAADLIVTPFRRYLHSGSIVHALSARRPVLTPATPFARDLQSQLPEGWLHLYEPPLTAAMIDRALLSAGTLTQAFPEKLSIAPNRQKLFQFFRELAGKKLPSSDAESKPARVDIPPAQAPLVSFILINCNYARFVGAAIDSIKAQDYPNFECIVVDDGSDDGSQAVIERHAANDRRFRIEHLPENRGHLAAALHAIPLTRGEFLAFIDSDDYLQPGYATAHVQAHLAAPSPAGLTSSSSCLISADGALIAGNEPCISENAAAVSLQRDQMKAVRLEWMNDAAFERLAARLYLCERSQGGWIWSPGSSNMFRRSAIDLGMRVLPDGIFRGYSPDNHFLRICHLMAGTVTIDWPLSFYRNHPLNMSGALPRMQRFGKNSILFTERGQEMKCQIAASFIRKRNELDREISRSRIWPSLEIILQVLLEHRLAYFPSPPVFGALSEQYRSLCGEFGERELLEDLSRYMRLRDIWRLAASQPGLRSPLRAGAWIAWQIARRPLIPLSGSRGW